MREIEDLVKRLKFFWAIGNPRAEVLAQEAIEKLQKLLQEMKQPPDRRPAELICPVCGEEALSSITARCSSCESISDLRLNQKLYFELLDAYKGSKLRILDVYREDEEDSSFLSASIVISIRIDLLESLFQLEGGSIPNNPLVLTASFPEPYLNWLRREAGVSEDSQMTKVSFKDFRDNYLVFRYKFSEWKEEAMT